MLETLLRTKLFVPPLRPSRVPRPRLIDRLSQGRQQGHKLTLICAPAGFGKTTVVSEWVGSLQQNAAKAGEVGDKIAWLSLDEGDNDLARFLTYLVATLDQIAGTETPLGQGAMGMLQSPQPPPVEPVLTALINDVVAISGNIILVLDDYHLINAPSIDDALNFLVERLPPQLHLVMATRDDPQLPLARLRARGQLTELRAVDLRFSRAEAAAFLNQVMGLNLAAEDIAALEARTEGWIAGLQLAALALQGPTSVPGRENARSLIKSFTGSHRFVLDYLIEEVLELQAESVQRFLLQTAVLDRLCGPLCDALTGQGNGQQTLETLEQANLFIVPLDNERRWYRYHHLFADLLRQQLQRSRTALVFLPTGETQEETIAALHGRASIWYEENGLEIEAFRHAAAANDIDRAVRLLEGKGTPLPFRGAVTPVLNWLSSLPTAVLDARPSLWVTYAMTVLATGEIEGVEEKLQAAEAALQRIEQDDKVRDLIGRIADTRGTMAVGQMQAEIIIAQSRRALEYLRPDNLTYRTATTWKLGVAYQIQGNRAAASQAYTEAISISQAAGNMYTNILATVGLANIQLAENQLYLAAKTYQRSLKLVGDLPIPVAPHVHLRLAQIHYQWNDLEAAHQHSQESLKQARPFRESSYIFVACMVFLARLQRAQGDVAGASALLAEADQLARQQNFVNQVPELADAQVGALLHRGKLVAAAALAEKHKLPISRARVHLAEGDATAALAVLEPCREQAEAKQWQDERLKVIVLQAVAYYAQDAKERAIQLLDDALALAALGGYIRIFLDEGPPMGRLLYEALSAGIAPDYVRQLLAAFPASETEQHRRSQSRLLESEFVEPLSVREIEVLQLIAKGLSNREIAARLYLSLNTVKVHTRNINGKLGVNNRTRAVARARALGILPPI